MGSAHPVSRRLGRLQDPLLQSIERIQAELGESSTTVSADARGNLFVSDLGGDALDPRVADQVIGTYNLASPLSAMEADLRHALRHRAREWIVDWNLPGRNAVDAHRRAGRVHRTGIA